MSNDKVIKIITHFYYCLLVYLRMRKVYSSKVEKQDNSRLIKKWLRNAKEKKLFDPLVRNEVDWLVAEIDRYTPIQFEAMIHKIYYLSKELIENDREK